MTFSIAPMMKWTDQHCRYFHRILTKKAILFTEMISVDAIYMDLNTNSCLQTTLITQL